MHPTVSETKTVCSIESITRCDGGVKVVLIPPTETVDCYELLVRRENTDLLLAELWIDYFSEAKGKMINLVRVDDQITAVEVSRSQAKPVPVEEAG